MSTLWLYKSVFSWSAEFDSGRRSEVQRVQRPHELLLHSERSLSSAMNEFGRADAILNLKRAINVRLQHLEELYAFANAFPKIVGALERLEAVGLARPLLIKQLFSLRNDIEHNDAAPPDEQRCSELLDATWYFLKTTDYACKVVPSGVALSSTAPVEERAESVTVRISAPSKVLEIYGWLRPATLSTSEKPGFISVCEEETEVGRLARCVSLAREGVPLGSIPTTDGRRLFFGKASAADDVIQTLWKRVLETL